MLLIKIPSYKLVIVVLVLCHQKVEQANSFSGLCSAFQWSTGHYLVPYIGMVNECTDHIGIAIRN